MLDYILTNDTLTVFTDAKIHTLTSTARSWLRAMTALQENNDAALLKAIDLTTELQTFYAGNDIRVENNVVFYNDRALHNCLTQRIIKMVEDGFDIQPLVNFLDNVMHNPSNRAVQELYGFLENNNLPITKDGCFIAYKRIRIDWKDCYTGTIDNSIGRSPSMIRNAVDDDCTRTCSHGLHVCSIEYLKNFCGDRLIAVKVNPADVVSVPIDYHNTKMRVCKYTVLSELDIATVKQTDDDWQAVYDEETERDENEEYDDSEDENEYAAECLKEIEEHFAKIAHENELHEAGCYGLM